MKTLVFGKGLVGLAARVNSCRGILYLSTLKKKTEIGKPFEDKDSEIPEVSLQFENVQGLDVLILQLNHIRSNMLQSLPPELRIGA
jgi:hypothetical protein